MKSVSFPCFYSALAPLIRLRGHTTVRHSTLKRVSGKNWRIEIVLGEKRTAAAAGLQKSKSERAERPPRGKCDPKRVKMQRRWDERRG